MLNESSFFWWSAGQFDHPFIFQEELIEHHYQFIQLLSKLFRVG